MQAAYPAAALLPARGGQAHCKMNGGFGGMSPPTLNGNFGGQA